MVLKWTWTITLKYTRIKPKWNQTQPRQYTFGTVDQNINLFVKQYNTESAEIMAQIQSFWC